MPLTLRHLIVQSKSSPSLLAEQSSSIPLSNGTCGLPVELWVDIFHVLFVQIVDPRSLATEFQDTESTSSSLICENSILSSVYETQSPQLFATRRTVALVCKSWHWMIIPTLRSHIYINMSEGRTKLERICSVLSSTPALASAVVRLSIQQGPTYAASLNSAMLVEPRSRIIARTLPYLTNLRVLACPAVLVRQLKDLRPGILIIGASYTGPHGAPLFHPTNVWNNIRGLFLQLGEERGVYDGDFPARFLNLVNLRLEVWKTSVIHWIDAKWDIGRPKTLSIESPSPQSWLGLIRRHGQELEALELVPLLGGQLSISPPNFSSTEGALELPKLKKLCLYHPTLMRITDPAANLFVDLKAPNLTRLCYHILSLKTRGQEFYRIAERVEASLKIWPRIEEFVISCWKDGDALRGERVVGGTRLVVSTAEMRSWCEKGIRVTIKERDTVIMELKGSGLEE